MKRHDAFRLIDRERLKQVKVKGYDAEHDARHDPLVWGEKLEHEIGCMFRRTGRPPTRAEFQAGLVKVAAVAVAALEALPEPPATAYAGISGICEGCGCTDESACTDGLGHPCSWANKEHTLCTLCADRKGD